MKNILILLGLPGCGKGTQAKKIAQDYGYIHVSAGHLLRNEVEEKTDLGLQIAEIISKGLFVSDEIISNLLFAKLEIDKKYILDGFPRCINQAEKLESFLLKNNLKIQKVVYLDLLETEIIARITGRRICKNCGKEYNVYIDHNQRTLCENCGITLSTRSDDNEEIITKRLEIYKRETYPLIDYYLAKDELVKINASDTPENVYKMILANLNLSLSY
jgi:adenylate kinase